MPPIAPEIPTRMRKAEETEAFQKAVLQVRKRKMNWGLAFKFLGVLLLLGSLILYLNNRKIEEKMKISSSAVLDELNLSSAAELERKPEETSELRLIKIGDYDYSGVVEIPDIDLKLPVIQGWDMDKLEIAPCNYSGSPYDEHFVLCAHNSMAHFGHLPELSIGSEITFRDFNHKRWTYRIVESQVYRDTAIEEIKSEEWDMTLFTCTYAGISRFAVRCELVEQGEW